MLHALTKRGKSQAWILSCCHSQEATLLLLNVVSRGTNGAIRCNQPLCQFTGFLWFSSLCVSCCKKRALKRRAREALDRLNVLVEEFCTSPDVHTAVEICHMQWIEMMLVVLAAAAAVSVLQEARVVVHQVPQKPLNLHIVPHHVSEWGQSRKSVCSKLS